MSKGISSIFHIKVLIYWGPCFILEAWGFVLIGVRVLGSLSFGLRKTETGKPWEQGLRPLGLLSGRRPDLRGTTGHCEGSNLDALWGLSKSAFLTGLMGLLMACSTRDLKIISNFCYLKS